jgi:hypothetical protein
MILSPLTGSQRDELAHILGELAATVEGTIHA